MSEKDQSVTSLSKAGGFHGGCPGVNGYPSDESNHCDVLITSDLWGVRSHGVAHLRCTMTYEGWPAAAGHDFKVVKDTPTTAVVDGGNGMGMVVGYRRMKLAMKRHASMPGRGAVRQFQSLWLAGYYP